MSIALFLCLSWHSAYGEVASHNRSIDINTDRYKRYIRAIERQHQIPSGLLAAIVSVESSYKPYAININGNKLIANGRVEAIRAIEEAIKAGITNIDMGLAQINYRWHKDNFSNIAEMLNPKTNILYAAKLLTILYKNHGSWNQAVRHYHSANSIHHHKYAKKVVTVFLAERDRGKIAQLNVARSNSKRKLLINKRFVST